MPRQSATPDATTATHRTVTTAPGLFAPGHLGELTQTVPFDMVDEALAQAGRTQQRLRKLPSRVMVYLLLAAALFSDQGYRQVWARLTSSLETTRHPTPSSSALARARKRLGPAPLKALFELLAGPPPSPARWRGLLVCAMDGTTMSVPDTPANLAHYSRYPGSRNGSAYPLLRLAVVVACQSRTVLGALYGPIERGEVAYTRQILGCVGPGTVLLGDRNFAGAQLIGQIARTGAQLLVRCKDSRQLPALQRLADGTWISRVNGMRVRVIDAHVNVHLEGAGWRSQHYRLITTLCEADRYPAADLVALYHQRWEVETAYRELKSTILDGRVLRARDPWGVDQEMYALLTAYQALRLAMADATAAEPQMEQDRASFSVALNAARDHVVRASGVVTPEVVDLVGGIGRAVLADPLPKRRVRVCPRIVKRAISKHRAVGEVDRTNYRATIGIAVLAGPGLTTSPSP